MFLETCFAERPSEARNQPHEAAGVGWHSVVVLPITSLHAWGSKKSRGLKLQLEESSYLHEVCRAWKQASGGVANSLRLAVHDL
jgi:hypothetical protein